MGFAGRSKDYVPIWRTSMKQWTADQREAYEHLAATLQYEAADVYPTREAAEKGAWDLIAEKIASEGKS